MLTLFLSSNFALASAVSDQQKNLANPFNDVNDGSSGINYCIEEFQLDNDGKVKVDTDGNPTPGIHDGYIYTIIEEPLNLEDTEPDNFKDLSKEDQPDFFSRICYRNSFSWTTTKADGSKDPNGNEKQDSVLTHEKCSQNAENLSVDSAYKNFQPKFSCQQVQVFFSKGGTSLIEGYISTIYQWGASVIGLVAVVVIIINGVIISFGGGDSSAIDGAKNRIIQALASIAVLFLSGLILYTINPNFFVQ